MSFFHLPNTYQLVVRRKDEYSCPWWKHTLVGEMRSLKKIDFTSAAKICLPVEMVTSINERLFLGFLFILQAFFLDGITSQHNLLNFLLSSHNDCWELSSRVEVLLIVNHVLYSNYGFAMIWIMPEFCSRPFEIKHENINFSQPRPLIPQYDTHGCYTVIAEPHLLSREQLVFFSKADVFQICYCHSLRK